MSTTPTKGRADYLELGSWNVACAECGRKFKAEEMRQLPPGVPGGGMWVCLPHWNQRQPQDFVRGIPERMAPPYVQPQLDYFPVVTNELTSSATTAASDVCTYPTSEFIYTVYEEEVIPTLTVLLGTGPAVTIRINNFGYVGTLVYSYSSDACAPGVDSSISGLNVNVAFSAVVANAPASVIINTVITPAITVTLKDANNNTLTWYTGSVTVTSSGFITGTLSVNAVSGVATFSDLQFTVAGTPTLTFTASILQVIVTAETAPITVIGYVKQYTVLYTRPSGNYIGSNGTFENGVFEGNVSPGFTATELYNFTASNSPINSSTGMSPGRLYACRYQSKLTPPGDSIYWAEFNTAIYLRNITTGSFQTISLPSLGFSFAAYEDVTGQLFSEAGGSLQAFTNLNWGAGTFTNNTSAFTSPFALTLVRNACLIDNRCYVVRTLGGGELGWFNATTGVYTQVTTYTNYSGRGIICADNYLGVNAFIAIQRGTTNQGNYIDIWESNGTLRGGIELPLEANNTYTNLSDGMSYDYAFGYLWLQNNASATRRIYVLDPAALSIVDIYSDAELPASSPSVLPLGPVGAAVGGVYAFKGTAGSYNEIIKIG